MAKVRREKKGRVDWIREEYDTIGELVRVLMERPNNEGMKYANSSETSSEKFSGTKNLKQALDFLNNGWTEKLGEIKKGLATKSSVKTTQNTNRRRPTTCIVGYAPCVPNAILGLPNSMIATENTPVKVKAVTIVYCPSVSAGWKAERLMKCGIEVLRIVNKLELDGVRVKLVVEGLCSDSGNGTTAQCLVTVKDWRQPLDLAKIAFPIAHPSLLRRIMFKWLETVPDMNDKYFSSGYGTPIPVRESYEDLKSQYTEAGYLGEKDFLITAAMVAEEKFNAEAVMKRAGIK